MFKVECRGQWVLCPADDCPAHETEMYLDCVGCYEQWQNRKQALKEQAAETIRAWDENAKIAKERRRRETIDIIQQTYVVDAKTGYDVHVQGPDLVPGRPALRYIAAVNLSREEGEAKTRELLGKPFRYGVTNIAVAHLYAGDRVVAHFGTGKIGKEGR